MRIYRRLAERTGCVVVAPDYRLSVAHLYPAALDDCYTALIWMRDNVIRLDIREDQLAVAGESAGGGLTAALTLLARDRGEVNIAFQMPIYPMLDDRQSTELSPEVAVGDVHRMTYFGDRLAFRGGCDGRLLRASRRSKLQI